MEADWSVALAADDPVITVPWATPGEERGFVDLRRALHLIDEIEEACARPPLRSALLVLNRPKSPLWSAKCGVWTSNAEPLDPYEMDAEPGETAFGAGSYIDLLARDLETRFERQEQWLRKVTARLRAAPVRAARVELVMRPAYIDGLSGFGVSWFVEGCGATAEDAQLMWEKGLGLALAVIME